MPILTDKNDKVLNKEISQKTSLEKYIDELADIYINNKKDDVKNTTSQYVPLYTARELHINTYSISFQGNDTLVIELKTNIFSSDNTYKILKFDKIILNPTILQNTSIPGSITLCKITDSLGNEYNILNFPFEMALKKTLEKITLEFGETQAEFKPSINRPLGELVSSLYKADFLGDYARIYNRNLKISDFPLFAAWVQNKSPKPFFFDKLDAGNIVFNLPDEMEGSYPALTGGEDLGSFFNFSGNSPKQGKFKVDWFTRVGSDGTSAGTREKPCFNKAIPLEKNKIPFARGDAISSDQKYLAGIGAEIYNKNDPLEFKTKKQSNYPNPIDYRQPNGGQDTTLTNSQPIYLYIKVI